MIGNGDAVTSSDLVGGRSLRSFELVFGCSTTAGDVARGPSFVSQSGDGAGIAVNLDRVAASGRA